MSALGWFPTPIVKELMAQSIMTDQFETNSKNYIEKAIKHGDKTTEYRLKVLTFNRSHVT